MMRFPDHLERLAPGTGVALLPHHAAILAESGIAQDVIAERGYFSATSAAEVQCLGFGKAQRSVPALVVPVHHVDGGIVLYQTRPDRPRSNRGKSIKYETTAGGRMALDVPPRARGSLGDPRTPLFVTEGVKKADAAVTHGLCCIALLGVWNWRGRNVDGGKTALADWERIALNGRTVYIVFDSDVMEKREVAAALKRLKAFFESRGSIVRVIYLPSGAHAAKVGLDDYLLHHTVDDLLTHATPDLRGLPDEDADDQDGPYGTTAQGLFWRRRSGDDIREEGLANFSATITQEIVEDDGTPDVSRVLQLEVVVDGNRITTTVPANQFASMTWVPEKLGPSAIIYAGFGTKDRVRDAIQRLSPKIKMRRVYTHTGWREIGGCWVYLCNGGAIGPNGLIPDVDVRLSGSLARFALPSPPEGLALQEAVRASLDGLKVAAPRITIPLFASIWRAVLGQSDFSLFLFGATGAGKSELAALAQQHFGREFDARHLPGAFSGTANSLEALGFVAKDTLFTVDDFAPHGPPQQIARMHADADRLLRAAGNQQGRSRMRADTSLRPEKPPRCLFLGTGEDRPRGQSVQARTLVLEIAKPDVDWDRLTASQGHAREGLYAAALAGFIQWLAPRFERLGATWATRYPVERQRAQGSVAHRRTASIAADLRLAFGLFLTFAVDSGALTEVEADDLWRKFWVALGEAIGAQAEHQADEDPARQFLRQLGSTITSGRAHLASLAGGIPPNAYLLGWQDGRPSGDLVGWIEGEDVFLDFVAAYNAAQRGAATQVPVSASTLRRRLAEGGHLRSTGGERGGQKRLGARRTIGGQRREFVHIAVGSLYDEVAHVAHASTSTIPEETPPSTDWREWRAVLVLGDQGEAASEEAEEEWVCIDR